MYFGLIWKTIVILVCIMKYYTGTLQSTLHTSNIIFCKCPNMTLNVIVMLFPFPLNLQPMTLHAKCTHTRACKNFLILALGFIPLRPRDIFFFWRRTKVDKNKNDIAVFQLVPYIYSYGEFVIAIMLILLCIK